MNNDWKESVRSQINMELAEIVFQTVLPNIEILLDKVRDRKDPEKACRLADEIVASVYDHIVRHPSIGQDFALKPRKVEYRHFLTVMMMTHLDPEDTRRLPSMVYKDTGEVPWFVIIRVGLCSLMILLHQVVFGFFEQVWSKSSFATIADCSKSDATSEMLTRFNLELETWL
ncbi:MAG: hypothetical protein ACFFF9_07660 [Candidatus Thorarchaeota archaeon]